MSNAPQSPAVGSRLAGRLLAVSVSPADDLPRLGHPPGQLNQALQALLVPLVSEGARIAYGGRVHARVHNYTLFISNQLAEAYRRLDQAPGSRPFVHFLALHVFQNTPAAELFAHLQRLAPYGEIWVTGDAGVLATLAAVSPESDQVAACSGCGLDAATDLQSGHGLAGLQSLASVQALRSMPVPHPSASYSIMRQQMAERCHARVQLGGRKSDFRGSISGLCEEALLTIAAGRPLYVLGGFGGASRDIAAELGLIDQDACVPRVSQPGETRYADGLQRLRDVRPAFEALFAPRQMPALRELARTESLSDAPELLMTLLT
ncbi:hypothetical protein [Ideonella sp. A 288]|uniref:hypothetical protein n=1 Tax=Ideonella sp. A 288 TaxID=1962181 RepID=UPI000B4A9045|nr:hypothetical protein [Ideonella sp. A 288]